MKKISIFLPKIIGLFGYLSMLTLSALLYAVLPITLFTKTFLLVLVSGSLTWFTYTLYFSPQKIRYTKLRKATTSCYTIALFIVTFVALYASTNYRFNFMLRLTGSLIKTSLHRQGSQQKPFNSLQLLATYTKLLTKYAISQDYPQQPHHDNLLGFSIDSYSYYDLNSLIHEIFAQQIYKFTTTSQQPLIIDCGSNIGISILYFKSLFPNAKIIGFEPDNITYKTLMANITNNNLDHVTIHQKALHPTKENITFYTRNNTPGYPGMNMFAMFDCPNKKVVSATPLSPYITQPVDFLKIDIEGTEALLLQELHHSKKIRLIKQIVLEFHPDKNSLAQTLDLLEKNNFNYVISSGAKTPFVKKDSNNLLLIYAFNRSYSNPSPHTSMQLKTIQQRTQ